MNWLEWYYSLAKPEWTPSPATISLIWLALYPVIFLSFGYVFIQAARGIFPGWRAIPFGINLLANLLFMPLFSGLRSLPLATLDIAIVWLTLLWAMIAIWRHSLWVALAQVPYFTWVSIASYLQVAILIMNPGR